VKNERSSAAAAPARRLASGHTLAAGRRFLARRQNVRATRAGHAHGPGSKRLWDRDAPAAVRLGPGCTLWLTSCAGAKVGMVSWQGLGRILARPSRICENPAPGLAFPAYPGPSPCPKCPACVPSQSAVRRGRVLNGPGPRSLGGSTAYQPRDSASRWPWVCGLMWSCPWGRNRNPGPATQRWRFTNQLSGEVLRRLVSGTCLHAAWTATTSRRRSPPSLAAPPMCSCPPPVVEWALDVPAGQRDGD